MKEFIEKVTEMLKSAKINYRHLEAVFKDSERNKETLNELLGLNRDNSYRKKITLEMTDAEFNSMYPFVDQVLKRVPGWVGPLRPTTGKLTVGKDQVNITKFLSKALADGAVPEDYKWHLASRLGIDRDNPKAESQIVPKLGELLNKKASNVVVVSTNPFDFFTSSAGDYKYASFKSCYRPGGEYFNGCNSLARDNFSTIAYKASADRLDYKHGRAWMFVLDKLVAQTKSYGTFTATERKIAREYVQTQLAAKHSIDFADYKHHHVEKWYKKSNNKVLYFDDYAIDLGYPKLDFPKGISSDRLPSIKFSNAKCLKCGNETQYPQSGLCGACSGNYRACYSCKADLYSIDDVRVNGQSYCPTCAARDFELCGHCGNYHERGAHTVIDGRKICNACISNSFFFCNHCNKYHRKDEIKSHKVSSNGELWCATCFTKDAFRCQDCRCTHTNDARHKVVYNGAELTVCSACVSLYATCPKCGVFFKGGHETCDGLLCSTCFESYEFCVGCNQFVLEETLTFNGKIFACTSCAGKSKGSHEKYSSELESIAASVLAAELEKTGDAVAALQRTKEDRDVNGFVVGDVLRIIANTNYHEYPIGTLVVNCKRYESVDKTPAYCTFRDNTEWFVKNADVEFARPALVPGDTFTAANSIHVLKDVLVGANDAISYVSTTGNTYPAEQCRPTDVIDPKAFATVTYKVGEVVEIIGNTSKHPYATGDKVKVMHVTSLLGLTRYVVKKGTQYGYILGSIMDIAKTAKAEEGPVKAPVKKVARKKAALKSGSAW